MRLREIGLRRALNPMFWLALLVLSIWGVVEWFFFESWQREPLPLRAVMRRALRGPLGGPIL